MASKFHGAERRSPRCCGRGRGRAAAACALATALCGRLLPQHSAGQHSRHAPGAAAFAVPPQPGSHGGGGARALAGAATEQGGLPPRARPPPAGKGGGRQGAGATLAARPALLQGVAASSILPWLPPRSGVWEALSAIFVSEIGDKTFFLTMVLALRRGKILALLSALSALWLMTGISCSIGVVLSSFRNIQPIVQVAAAAMMLIFGIQSLREGIRAPEQDCDEREEAECEINLELKKAKPSTLWQWVRFTVLIFLAEWGDRSMFVTVTLAASRSPFGVFLGGCAGHFGAAILAVLCGSFLEQYVSDRLVRIIGGILFVGFGLTTLLGVY